MNSLELWGAFLVLANSGPYSSQNRKSFACADSIFLCGIANHREWEKCMLQLRKMIVDIKKLGYNRIKLLKQI